MDNNINVVSPDRSYLESFIWQDTDTPGVSGLLHVILRGYPDRAKIPTCLGGVNYNTPMPCFAAPHGLVTENGIRATLYTVNQDADAWHLLLLWHHKRRAVHASPSTWRRRSTTTSVVSYLKHELASLVLIAPDRRREPDTA